MLRIVLLALALLLATTAHAHAGFVAAAVGAIASAISGAIGAAGLGALLLKTALTVAFNVGVSLLERALLKKDEPVPSGVQLDVEVGDDAPIGFIVGDYATAGTRRYIGVWGRAGKTPNAFLTDVIQIGDMPAPGRPELWVNGELCTIDWDDDSYQQGHPVLEYRTESGKNHLWVQYLDGTQDAADAFLLEKFGNDPDRPWKSDMIGRGCPILIITAQFNRDLFPGQVQWIGMPPPVAFYDVRKDSSAGGDGPHRWHDPSTWEPTRNPAIIIYNIIRGIYYGIPGAGEWMFGGQNLPAFRLPAANWMAAANECDVLVNREDGTQEPQFRVGYEIRGTLEPLSVIEEMEKACSGRVVEMGGIFKMQVGAPGTAVYSFTDDDIVVTQGQSLRPWPSLEETYNAVEATYPEPAEAWGTKDAPARYSSELEAEDGDRRLATGVNFAAAPYAVQVQRLLKPMIEEERRFRIHSFYLPPEAWLLEPNDVVSWTSPRNGYVNKKFRVDRIVGEPGMNQLVLLKEWDPSDYDWNPATDEQPTGVSGVIGPVRPPAQLMSGWQVGPATIYDAEGKARRPTIEVFFDGDLDDVRAVRVQVRLKASQVDVFDGEQPYGDPDPDNPIRSVLLNGTFLPDTQYEARGIYVPYSGRREKWSAWLSVLTDNVKLGPDDVDYGDIEEAVEDLTRWANWNTREELEEALANAALDIEDEETGFEDKQELRREVASTTGRLRAEVTEDITVLTGEQKALAQQLTQVKVTLEKDVASAVELLQTEISQVGDVVTANAQSIQQLRTQVDNVESSITVRGQVESSPGGGWARYGVDVRVGSGNDWSQGAFYIDVNGNQSRTVFISDQFVITDGTNIRQAFVFQNGVATLNVVNVGTVTAGLVRGSSNKMRIELDNDRILVSD
ncbi:phage tail protein [Chelativorans sp. YIM 93263]|uniref:phage tail protein n=1 Tax=Chelativorans sp. YIM 93263 TaxID=2906648 RepID=UPI0023786A3D|nr:phage tail protein [Chelativorans sp. YIM 93263]